MRKLRKYLKPYGLLFLVAVAFLFVQAVSELNLPNMMSNIINVGIQQNGIKHAAPEVIGDRGYAFMRSFMTKKERARLDRYYRHVPAAAVDRRTYDKLAKGEGLYQLKTKTDTAYDTLDPIFSRAGWTFIEFIQDKDNLAQIKKAAAAQARAKLIAQARARAAARGMNLSAVSDKTLLAMLSDPAQAAKLGLNAKQIQAMNQGSTGGSADFKMGGKTTSSNLNKIDMTEVYPLTPAIRAVGGSAMQRARDKAMKIDTSMQSQTGAVFVKLFGKELGVDIGARQQSYIVRTGLKMIGLTVLSALAAISVGFLASRIAAGMARNLREDLFQKVTTFSSPEFSRFGTASLITRSTNDITQLQTFIIMAIRMVCYAPIIGTGGIIMALRRDVSMAWVIALAVIVLLGLIAVVAALVMPKFKIMQKLIDRLNLVMRENLNGMEVVRAFSNQSHEAERFDGENTAVTQNNLFVNRVIALMMPVMMLMMNGVTLLIVWVGAHQIADSAMQVGDMMAFMQYSMQIIIAFVMVAVMFIMIPRAQVSAERIAEVIETEPAVQDPTAPAHFPGAHPGRVIFDHVSFRYAGADEDVLHDISFVAEPGQTVAFIGSTGSGKSTLVNLIPRFADVTAGRITIDNTDIRAVSLHELRDHIGFVPQRATLFSGTVASNLRFGRADASDEAIRIAAEIAQATEFIDASPEGYDRAIAQGGSNVSGGQKQRLAIARALAKQPDLYIFDDSFSALDFKTDAVLRRALRPYTQKAAVLIVAQRVNTIMDADQIVVLDEGRVAGIGRHDALIETCETYRDIVASQLGKGEA
ncbi:ABC transporter ATP-binding protein [Pseudoramibacter faecis]|uniref:ABC transporter ATP-binding protein n=1 Tax=Pseudoramibacter faecis TaxID=3108534 RepID=UPI002E7866C2|nr:ABC transporter ATP-binding protein [Pseudoramibacter sp. HA2172]